MHPTLLFPAGTTQACRHAAHLLSDQGIPTIDHPAPDVTHLLLDVPSFLPDGSLRGGGDLNSLLSMLPPTVTVIGGNLSHPDLAGHPLWDLLRDPDYLCQNAAITAHCALEVAAPLLPTTFADTPTLILGWGRIGKCLAQLLHPVSPLLTVAARDPAQRGLLHALGYHAADFSQLPSILSAYRLIINTVPAPVLTQAQLSRCPEAVKLDLASTPGLEGADVVVARGLPGRYAPASSGKRIAQTILQQLQRRDSL